MNLREVVGNADFVLVSDLGRSLIIEVQKIGEEKIASLAFQTVLNVSELSEVMP